jgi:type VI protein secretion system component Hcp
MGTTDNLEIVVRVGTSLTTNAQCRLAGYDTGWFIADEFNFGIQNEPTDFAETTEADAMGTTFGTLTIKKSIDPCTPLSFLSCCKGNGFNSIEIHLLQTYYRVETGENANPQAVSPIFIARFEVAQIEAWSIDGSLSNPCPKETINFNYEKVASGWVNQKDGSVISKGWSTDWAASGTQRESVPWEYSFKARGRNA